MPKYRSHLWRSVTGEPSPRSDFRHGMKAAIIPPDPAIRGGRADTLGGSALTPTRNDMWAAGLSCLGRSPFNGGRMP
jgi:hypothetical protein